MNVRLYYTTNKQYYSKKTLKIKQFENEAKFSNSLNVHTIP